MCDSDTPNEFGQFQIENGVGKTFGKNLAKPALPVRGPSLWIFLNFADGLPDLFHESNAESFSPTLVKRDGITEFSSRGSVEFDWLHECLATSSENTLSAGSPIACPLLISSARRSKSTSLAVSG